MEKVAIVGGSPLTRELAPFDDTEWDIWVLGNQLHKYEDKRVTRVFEVHENLSEHGDVKKYAQYLLSKNLPLVVSKAFPFNGVRRDFDYYPKDEVNNLLENKLTSSPAYMMGLAILEGYKEIGIYGIEMAVDDHEYFHQRPAMYAWIAYAQAKGITITIPKESTLFNDSYDEGRDWNNERESGIPPFTTQELEKMETLHEQKIEECKHQINLLEAKINTHDGARQTYSRLKKIARGIESGAQITSLTESAVIR